LNVWQITKEKSVDISFFEWMAASLEKRTVVVLWLTYLGGD